jgi:predicted SprT family Zn-dependent metalloprotease
MLTLFCENCGEKYYAEERHAGHLIRCKRCDHVIQIKATRPSTSPTASVHERVREHSHQASGKKPVTSSHEAYANYGLPIIGVGLLILLALYASFSGHDNPPSLTPAPPPAQSEKAGPAPPSIARTPAQAREEEIVAHDTGRLGDPTLNAEYQEINERHFSEQLPSIPVLWESRLKEVGPLIAEDYRLEGLWARHDGRQLILINPVVRKVSGQLQRVLCHEVVHEYLFTKGDTTTNHGPAFQEVLRRLSEEGAFEGKWASESEKASFKAWLDQESLRLDEEKSELDRVGEIMERDHEELDSQFNELNQRISAANDQGLGWPSNEEVESIKSKRDLFNERVEDYDNRCEKYTGDAARFNRQVNRYNLMMSYPDGLDEVSFVQPRRNAGVRKLRH